MKPAIKLAWPATIAIGLLLVALVPSSVVAPIDASVGSLDLPVPCATDAGSGTCRADQTVQHEGFYLAALGRTFDVDLTAAMKVGLQHGTASPGEIQMQITGRMLISVWDFRRGALCLEIRMDDVSAIPQAAFDASKRDIEKGCNVLMTPDGEVLGYRFPDGSSPIGRNWLRTLFSAFRFVVRSDDQQYEVDEADAMGVARYSYRRQADERLSRQKLEYKQPQEPRRNIRESRAIARLNQALGWVEHANVSELTDLDLGMFEMHVTQEFTGSMRLRSVRDLAQHESLPRDWDAGWGPAAGHEESSGFSQDLSAETLRQALRGVEVDDLVREMSQLLAMGRADSREMYEAWERLSWSIKLDARVVTQLQATLAALTSEVAAMVLTALGNAGTDEAQGLLSEVAFAADTREPQRIAALQSMIQLHSASNTLLGGLDRLLSDTTAPLGVHGAALLASGCLIEKGCASTLSGRLLAAEDRYRQLGLVDVWLEALGNAGLTEAVARIDAYLIDEDAGIRQLAITALRRVTGDDAAVRLSRVAAGDSNASVRAAAAEVLARTAAKGRLQYVSDILAAELDPVVRRSTVLGLASEWPIEPAARRVLERVAVSDVDARIRELVGQLLAGR